MSPDEVIVTVVAVLVGSILWTVWLFRMSRLETHGRGGSVTPVSLALALCAGLLLYVLETGASFDVPEETSRSGFYG